MLPIFDRVGEKGINMRSLRLANSLGNRIVAQVDQWNGVANLTSFGKREAGLVKFRSEVKGLLKSQVRIVKSSKVQLRSAVKSLRSVVNEAEVKSLRSRQVNMNEIEVRSLRIVKRSKIESKECEVEVRSLRSIRSLRIEVRSLRIVKLWSEVRILRTCELRSVWSKVREVENAPTNGIESMTSRSLGRHHIHYTTAIVVKSYEVEKSKVVKLWSEVRSLRSNEDELSCVKFSDIEKSKESNEIEARSLRSLRSIAKLRSEVRSLRIAKTSEVEVSSIRNIKASRQKECEKQLGKQTKGMQANKRNKQLGKQTKGINSLASRQKKCEASRQNKFEKQLGKQTKEMQADKRNVKLGSATTLADTFQRNNRQTKEYRMKRFPENGSKKNMKTEVEVGGCLKTEVEKTAPLPGSHAVPQIIIWVKGFSPVDFEK
ncbi:hypothetical protein DPMN_033968 [Dreissena polymorpha]|uniref:Uncharacterized protein n=1 Tax=Dreissena polymorpha TaxID=45954 RepID=A0A9D4RKF0_DREPO|nr:hypothetical protein DPMN_033968 [Dreissena polymorpha]